MRHDGLEHTIYDAEDDNREARKDTPQIIEKLNDHLRKGLEKDTEAPTVENIALKLGISKDTLCGWVKNDQEISQTLERLKTVQENDPIKSGTNEDSPVNAMAVTLLLMEKS